MIDPAEQEYLRQRFAQEITGKVRIDYFTQHPTPLLIPGREECPLCEDVRQVLEDVAALSDRISLTVREFSEAQPAAEKLGVQRVPGIALRSGTGRVITFHGAPGGGEFPAFIDMIVAMSAERVELAPGVSKTLKRLKDRVTVTVFVTPACPHCPRTVLAATRLALASANVRLNIVEIAEFPRLAQAYGIQAVPATLLNESALVPGAMDEALLAEVILKVATGRPVAPEAVAATTVTPVQAVRTEGQSRSTGSGLILP